MRRDDFSVIVVIVVLNCSVQQHLGSGPVSAQFWHKHKLQGDVLTWAAGKYGIFFTLFNIWIAADLRSGRGGCHISNSEPEE